MMKIAICDDVPAVCFELEHIILEFQKQNVMKMEIEVFYDGEKMLKYMREEHRFDLIFLDIELGKVNGLEIGHIIRSEMEDYITKIVYISSKNSYDRQLFEVQPLHFLSKPLDKEKVVKDIRLAIKVLNKENNSFSFKIGHDVYKIPIKEIMYFESFDREIKMTSVNGSVLFYEKIDVIAKQLLNFRFMRPHRSYLVNYDHIISFKKDTIVMSNGNGIPISRLKSKEIKTLQIAYEEDRL